MESPGLQSPRKSARVNSQVSKARALPKLASPIAVFDAGIGSYAAVEAIRRLLPRQDILYLADRASITGQFSDADLRHLDQAFPLLLKQLELMLTSGELNPCHQHCVTLYAKGLTCEADSLGSHGYVYLAIYPTPAATE